MTKKQKKIKCLACLSAITSEELEFEDYYKITRGHTPEAEEGYLCFDCLQAIRKAYVDDSGKDGVCVACRGQNPEGCTYC